MKCPPKYLGSIITAFGIGVIVSAFIPTSIIVIIEGAVIISSGLILFK